MIVYNTIFAISLAAQYEIYDTPNHWDLHNSTKYTIEQESCQTQRFESILEYNYITTEKYIQTNIDKYQDILP